MIERIDGPGPGRAARLRLRRLAVTVGAGAVVAGAVAAGSAGIAGGVWSAATPTLPATERMASTTATGVQGLDVSSIQSSRGTISWTKVKDAGQSFVYVKATEESPTPTRTTRRAAAEPTRRVCCAGRTTSPGRTRRPVTR
ncbi:hypothetical protein [Micromonospora zhanjiangensis]